MDKIDLLKKMGSIQCKVRRKHKPDQLAHWHGPECLRCYKRLVWSDEKQDFVAAPGQ